MLHVNSGIENSNQPSLKLQVETKKFTFTHVEKVNYKGFTNKKVQDDLFKWGLQENMYMKRFHYDQYLPSYKVETFIDDFFNDPIINNQLKAKSSGDNWISLPSKKGKVSSKLISTTTTNMDFFDVLYTRHDIIRKSTKQIVKCLDEVIEPFGFIVSDELRKSLILDDDRIFSKDERQEFLFHIFKVLALGGRICQYEDDIDQYLQVSKLLYKDLISVRKVVTPPQDFQKDVSTTTNGDDKPMKLEVSSLVYKINGFESDTSSGGLLFPINHPQNFCYISIKGVDGKGSRIVDVWYHASDVFYQ